MALRVRAGVWDISMALFLRYGIVRWEGGVEIGWVDGAAEGIWDGVDWDRDTAVEIWG